MKNDQFSLRKNAIFNVLGWVVPILVNFISIPIIVQRLGYDQYGIWTLVMAVMGYFALLDLGVVRGGIRFIADSNARNDLEKMNQVISLGVLFYFGIGLFGCGLIYLSTSTFLLKILAIPGEFEPLARTVFGLAAFGFLTTMMQAYLLSLPQALHRFDISNKVDAAFQIMSTVLIVAFLLLGHGLVALIVIRIGCNLLAITTLVCTVGRCFPSFRWTWAIPRPVVREVLSYSLVSFIGKVGHSTGNYLQTLVVGSMLGTTAVTLFSIPFQLVSRIANISPKLAFALFPIASELGASRDIQQLHHIYHVMTRYLFFLNVAVLVLFTSFSWDILNLWMGKVFADQASVILTFIAIGYFFNSLTNLPSQVCDGMNNPKITSTFAFLSGGVCILFNLIGGHLWGVVGIAAGYMVACAIMSVSFNLYVHNRVIGLSYRRVILGPCLESAILGLVVLLTFLPLNLLAAKENQHFGMVLIKAMSVALVFGVFGYLRVLDTEARKKIHGKLGLVLGKAASIR